MKIHAIRVVHTAFESTSVSRLKAFFTLNVNGKIQQWDPTICNFNIAMTQCYKTLTVTVTH